MWISNAYMHIMIDFSNFKRQRTWIQGRLKWENNTLIRKEQSPKSFQTFCLSLSLLIWDKTRRTQVYTHTGMGKEIWDFP